MDLLHVVDVIKTHLGYILGRCQEEDEAQTGRDLFFIDIEDETCYFQYVFQRRYELDQIEYETGLDDLITLERVEVDQDGIRLSASLVSPGMGVDYRQYAYR